MVVWWTETPFSYELFLATEHFVPLITTVYLSSCALHHSEGGFTQYDARHCIVSSLRLPKLSFPAKICDQTYVNATQENVRIET